MEVFINDVAYQLPEKMHDITLGQWVTWKEEYGAAIDEEIEALAAKDWEAAAKESGLDTTDQTNVETLKKVAWDALVFEEGLCWFTFWTGADFRPLRHDPEVVKLIGIYQLTLSLIHI